MGRTVAADGSIEEQADRIRASAAGSIQVGLLLGKGSAGATPSLAPSTASTVSSSAPGFGSSSGASAGASKDVLLALLPTPPAPDGTEGAVNVDWVQEHARQVLRMTCGGISLLGLFACCTDSLYKTHHPDLIEALGAVAELVAEQQEDVTALVAERTRLAWPAASKGTATALPLQGQEPAPEMLLLHICSKPKRLTLFSLPAGAGGRAGGSRRADAGQLVAAELRPNPQALSSLVELRTVHQVDACIPLTTARSVPRKRSAAGGSSFPNLRAALERLLRTEARALAAAEVATGVVGLTGQGIAQQDLRIFQDADSIQLSSLTGRDAVLGPSSSSSSGGTGKGKSQGKGGGKGGSRSSGAPADQGAQGAVLQVQLLRPPCWASLAPSGDDDSIDEVAGVLRVCGTVSGVAVAGPRDAAASAFWSLKVDLFRSLRSRLDILVEEAEEALETSGEGQGGEGAQAGEGGREQGDADAEAEILRLAHTVGGVEADTKAFLKKWSQGRSLRLVLPRRLLLPWRPGAGPGQGSGGKGALPLSDYPLPHEGEEESLERLRAMLPLDAPELAKAGQESLLLALEPAPPELAPTQTLGASAGASTFWSVTPSEGLKQQTSLESRGAQADLSSSAVLLASALLVALLAVLVALYFSLA